MSEDRFQLLRLLEAVLFASAEPIGEKALAYSTSCAGLRCCRLILKAVATVDQASTAPRP